MKGNKHTTGFLVTLLDCMFSEVLLSAMMTLDVFVCTNEAFEQSLQKTTDCMRCREICETQDGFCSVEKGFVVPASTLLEQ